MFRTKPSQFTVAAIPKVRLGTAMVASLIRPALLDRTGADDNLERCIAIAARRFLS
jgi:hypothetical protein